MLSQANAGHVFFVQDNFLNDVQRALELMHALAQSTSSLTWNCYATLPEIDDRVICALAQANCTGVYLGVDAVSDYQKREFGKSFIRDESDFKMVLRKLLRVRVVPTAALMVNLYAWRGEDIRAVLTTALACALLGAP